MGHDGIPSKKSILGMPCDVGASKSGAFKYLKDHLWSKIQGWMEKLLSVVGKEILGKLVGQAIWCILCHVLNTLEDFPRN